MTKGSDSIFFLSFQKRLDNPDAVTEYIYILGGSGGGVWLKIFVSACLLGMNCRYCGGGCLDDKILSLASKHSLVPVCPEQLGGLPTPREPDEIRGGRVVSKSGADNTEYFRRGASEVLRLAKMFGCDVAVLKERSPSCGSSMIYDGTFTGHRIPGAGVTASLLMENGVRVFSEENIDELLAEEGDAN